MHVNLPGISQSLPLQIRAPAADYPHMARFWLWGVHNPALLLAVLAAATGAAAVLEWGLALTTATFFAVIAYISGHLGRRARAREQRRAQIARELQEVSLMRGRFSKQKEPQYRKAA